MIANSSVMGHCGPSLGQSATAIEPADCWEHCVRRPVTVEDVLKNRQWLAAHIAASRCSKCLVALLNDDHFPDFVDLLSALWREHDKVYRSFKFGSSGQALQLLRPLVERSEFRAIELPNGAYAELRLEKARSETELRLRPSRVFIAPRRCRCRTRRLERERRSAS
jgi:hypothetical protein